MAALYNVASLLSEVPLSYSELLPRLPRPARHYQARTMAQLPAYIHGLCDEDDNLVLVVHFFPGRPKRRPTSIFRRPLDTPSSVFGGEVQVQPPPHALDPVGQRFAARSLSDVTATVEEMPRTLFDYLTDPEPRKRTKSRYERMLYEEVLVAIATHRYTCAAYDQLGMYEVAVYDADVEEEGHEVSLWTSGWLFPINALVDEPDLGSSQGRSSGRSSSLRRHYCVYGGQA